MPKTTALGKLPRVIYVPSRVSRGGGRDATPLEGTLAWKGDEDGGGDGGENNSTAVKEEEDVARLDGGDDGAEKPFATGRRRSGRSRAKRDDADGGDAKGPEATGRRRGPPRRARAESGAGSDGKEGMKKWSSDGLAPARHKARSRKRVENDICADVKSEEGELEDGGDGNRDGMSTTVPNRRLPSRREAASSPYADTDRRRVDTEGAESDSGGGADADDCSAAESSAPAKGRPARRECEQAEMRGRKRVKSEGEDEDNDWDIGDKKDADEADGTPAKLCLEEVMDPPKMELLSEAQLGELLKQIDQTKSRGARWVALFGRLRSFQSIAGHCNVPMQYPPDQTLANWVGLMRKEYKKGGLDPVKTKLLEGTGFEWSVLHLQRRELRESVEKLPEGMRKVTSHSAENARKWDEFWTKLREWRDEHGNTHVPQRPQDGDEAVARLGKWVSRQRVQYGLKLRRLKSDMTDERVAKLNELDFSWRRYDTQEPGTARTRLKWSDRFEQMKVFKEKHGTFEVAPNKEDEFPGLRTFVVNQRNACRKFDAGFTEEANMTKEKLEQLRSIGFSWEINPDKPRGRAKSHPPEAREGNSRETRWEEMLETLREYKEENGHCNVPVKVTTDPGEEHPHKRLSAWVKTQRRQYRLLELWSKSSEEEREEMKERSFITEERIKRLDEIGFLWKVRKRPSESESDDDDDDGGTPVRLRGFNKDRLWVRRFEALCRYKEEHGHCNVKVNVKPKEGEEHPHPKLSSWVRTQRRQHRFFQKWKDMTDDERKVADEKKERPVITEERIRRLEEVGFQWVDPARTAIREDARKRKAESEAKMVKLSEREEQVKKKRRGGYGRPNDEKWERMFQQLCEYRKKHGNCNVKVKNNTECPVLGTWVKTQRRRYKLIQEGRKACLPQHRIDKLESIGFKWVEVGTHWEESYDQLLRYVAEHGHANVPNVEGPHRKLATWVMTQRRQYKLFKEGKPSHMTQERIVNLERAGIMWEIRCRGGKTENPLPRNVGMVGPAVAVAESLAMEDPLQPSVEAAAGNVTQEQLQHDWAVEAQGDSGMDVFGTDWTRQNEAIRGMGAVTLPPIGTVTNQPVAYAEPLQEVAAASGYVDGLAANPAVDEWAPAPLAEVTVIPAAAPRDEAWKVGIATEEETTPVAVTIFEAGPITEPCHQQNLSDSGQHTRPQSFGGGESGPDSDIGEKLMASAELAWRRKIEALKIYKKEHGNLLVPNKYKKDPALGRWVKNLRWEWTKLQGGGKTRLSPDRLAQLDELGFVWTVKKGGSFGQKSADGIDFMTDLWMAKYNDLKTYYADHGHSCVPNRFKPDLSLGAWVKTQRWEFKKLKRGEKSSMTEEKIKFLEDLDFNWAPLDNELTGQDLWLKRYGELKEYKEENGHCKVPRKYLPNLSLGNWVTTQRHQRKLMQQRKKSEMTAERIELLDALGFTWALRERSTNGWVDWVKDLEAFKEKMNHLRVPNNSHDNPPLGRWCKKMRAEYDKLKAGEPSYLDSDKLDVLEKMDFEFDASKCETKKQSPKAKKDKKDREAFKDGGGDRAGRGNCSRDGENEKKNSVRTLSKKIKREIPKSSQSSHAPQKGIDDKSERREEPNGKMGKREKETTDEEDSLPKRSLQTV